MERSRKSRIECFPICLPCSCCEYGKLPLKMGVLEVWRWEEQSLPHWCQFSLKYPSSMINQYMFHGWLCMVTWPCPYKLSPKALCSMSFLLAHAFLQDFIVDPNAHSWQLGT